MSVNAQQVEQWNGVESDHWVQHADQYDQQLAPFADALFERAEVGKRDRLLDVGCGCGATTITASLSAMEAVGADLSGPMLDVARRRAAEAGRTNTRFLVADAQTYPFGSQCFESVISRFGVMFFDDPGTAFGNLHGSLVRGGKFGFMCWQPLDVNEWLLVPGMAAAQHVALPDMETGDGPGMFSLADPVRARNLLEDAGFDQITAEDVSTKITLGGGGDVDETLDFLLGTGIARAVFEGAAPEAIAPATEAVRAALSAHFEAGVGVRLGAQAWMITARA